MSFDLSKIDEGTWFPFFDSEIDFETGKITYLPPDPESKERVCFRPVDADELREIKDKFKGKKINVPVVNTLTRGMEIVHEYEQTLEQEKGERMAFWDKAIRDWEIFDTKGNPIPCTAENKYKLVKGSSSFLRYANRCLQLLNGTVQAQREEEIKNF